MVFLPGHHVLNTNITVANVARLTMHGESSSGNTATVVCSGSVGLRFTSMMEFRISFLAFTSCSRDFGSSSPTKYALLLDLIDYVELVNCSFHYNLGTALVLNRTKITLAGNSAFTHNHCTGSNSCLGGGGIVALSSNLTFTGNTSFLGNNATFGAAGIYMINCIFNSTGNVHFTNNIISSFFNNGGYAAGAIWASTSSLYFTGTNNFIANSADYAAGAIYVECYTVLCFTGTNNFINNSASNAAGTIYATDYVVLTFNGINNFISNLAHSGGAIYTYDNSVLSFNGVTNFTANLASDYAGGAVYAETNVSLSFAGSSNFNYNVAAAGGAIYTDTNTTLSFMGTTNFIGNSAANTGGAICTSDTKLSFSGTSTFDSNIAIYDIGGYERYGGGALNLKNSAFSLLPNTTLYWENNHAALGGAIYVDDNPFIYCNQFNSKKECFFQLPNQNLSKGIDIQLIFRNNSADVAGSVLYGGAIDNCKMTDLDSYNSGEVFDMLVHIEDDNKTSTISSEPFRICPCKNNFPDCSNPYIPYIVYPGEMFNVSMVAVGQRNGIVPTGIRSSIDTSSIANLLAFQYIQQVNATCTTLNYTVFSLSYAVFLDLYADGPCSTFGDELKLDLNINRTCPSGFSLSELVRSCVCEPVLAKYTNLCKITNGVGQITRTSHQQFWVGYDQSDGLILHPHCPLDYCTSHTVDFPLNDTDLQCAYNRSGLLCGACKEGYSLVLGTFKCKQCTNSHLALLIPFALMGVALVSFLLVCKLTVVAGTLSGLVFYANIVGVNHAIFLPRESTNVLLLFISWLNLDFGIETCFYDGMDANSKAWLQFVFPVYILVLVGLIIILTQYSQRFANLLGNNPVSVLATLVLLSYTKILHTLITAINITYLEYPTYNRSVWLYNANIDYFSGEHIPLFIAAVLVFFFLFLPYTLLLLFGQWLPVISHLRFFSWVNSARLKPFMDSYHAPYKVKHRYWPGLLLLLRFVLFLVFALNLQQDPNTNLLAILVVTGILQMWAWISGGVYRNWCLDALESLFVLNLIILAAATMYVNVSAGNQVVVGYTLISIAFTTFLGILSFHLADVTGIARYLNRKYTVMRRSMRRRVHQVNDEVEYDIDTLPDRLINPVEYEPPLSNAQDHAMKELTELVNDAQKITPMYTYGSIN